MNHWEHIVQVRVLHLPGHSPGSLGLLDQENGVLATGDTLYRWIANMQTAVSCLTPGRTTV